MDQQGQATTVEHAEWEGEHYKAGIQGQRIAVVGFSHWGDANGEDPDFTCNVLSEVREGRSHAFFDRIQEYFGHRGDYSFWDKVLFFNFIPTLIGGGDERYAYGTPEQHNRGRERFLQIIGRQLPEKVLVFSRKTWDALGPFRAGDDGPHQLGAGLPAKFEWGRYEQDGHMAAAFGLRHTQGAKTEEMTRAVEQVLKTDVRQRGPQ